jgi:hypothetical protein
MSGTGQSREPVAIMPIEFWTEYTGEGADLKAADWVRWVKKGDSMRPTVSEKVSRLKKGMIGEEIWAVIKPYYDRWKDGQDKPIIGMPLEAAPFATKEMIRVLAQVEICSVEDLANAEEAALNKMPIPGILGMRAKARALLDARANLAPVSEELAALRQQVEALQKERDVALELADEMAKEADKKRSRKPEGVAAALG